MSQTVQWFLIEGEEEYLRATRRYEEVKHAAKNSEMHKEKLLLAHLISTYESKEWDLPAVDPIATIKIRMEAFGYKASDLAKAYGDKGTLSKVLNYQRALPLSMIRKFSKMLRIPADMLIQEYALKV